ncbi:MAG: hypothetical protein ACJ780_31540 [Solirubrobacteraceae bacterium]|jgi:hypothetical protein
MSKKEEEYCPTCGAKIVEYQHTLNMVMVNGLRALAQVGGGPAHLETDLNLNRSENRNFQKMRYYKLVEKSFTEDGLRIKGCWNITPKGRAFLAGTRWCYPTVVTWRGEATRFKGEPILIQQVGLKVDEAEDYAANAIPHDPNAPTPEEDTPEGDADEPDQ